MTATELNAELVRIKTLSGAEALALVKTFVADISDRVVLLVAAWKRASELGHAEALGQIRHGLFRFIPKVADEKLLPQLVAMFGNAVATLALVAELNKADQQKVADGALFPFVIQNSDGSFDTIKASVPALSIDQARQLFHQGYVRPVAEQRFHLESRGAPTRHAATVTAGKVVVDRRTQTVRIGRSSAPAVDVVRALAEAGLIVPPAKRK